MQTYEPREDSYLLLKHVKKYAKGSVLDLGTGSGIQALEAAKLKKVKKVIAADINKKLIKSLKKKNKKKKINFLTSDLFSNIKTKFDMSVNRKAISDHAQKPMVFDTIIFNPPYLPEDAKLKDLTLDGGKKGYEILEKFLNQVNDYIKPNSNVLIVFSSLTKKDKIDEFIQNNMLEYKLLDKKHIFFEDLFVYLIKKSKVLIELEKKKIKNIKKLTHGHRGLVYTGIFRNKKVAIKVKNPRSEAVGRIFNEAKHLKVLNHYKIGPKMIIFSKDFLVYEFIEGNFILDFIEKSNKKQIIKILRSVFKQMHTLDTLKIDKEEMHHPLKHVIVNKNSATLIDFERTHFARNPHNVTQFCEFMLRINKLLKKKKIKITKKKMIELSRKYKHDMSKNSLKAILNEIQ